ncbi:MAG: CsbD family protein [Chitinispirillaceae bacterium]|nr:CsbD family protein [Chitinispirillaceae bacterium]
MKNLRIKGILNETAGKIKQKIAGITGDDALLVKGKKDEVVGKAQKKLGKAQEELHDIVEKEA